MINYYAQEAAQTAVSAGLGGAIPLAILSTLLSVAVVAVLVVYVIAGCYQGSVKSGTAMLAVLVSLVLARIFMPLLGGAFASNQDVMEQVLYYSDAEDILGTIKVWSQPVEGMTEEELTQITDQITLPSSLKENFVENVTALRFAEVNAETLADYLSYTIAYYTLNTLAFVTLFIVCYLVLYLALHMMDSVIGFPVMRYVDIPVGGLIGLLRGLTCVSVLFMLMPVILTYLPLEQIATIVDHSHLATWFMEHNALLHWVRGWL